jgi:hypothetical protein
MVCFGSHAGPFFFIGPAGAFARNESGYLDACTVRRTAPAIKNMARLPKRTRLTAEVAESSYGFKPINLGGLCALCGEALAFSLLRRGIQFGDEVLPDCVLQSARRARHLL